MATLGSTLLGLQPELLRSIIQHVPTWDLPRLRLACKALAAAVEPLMTTIVVKDQQIDK